MRRALVLLALAALAGAAPAGAAVKVRSVDTSSFPNIRVTILTPQAGAAQPQLFEGGAPAAAVVAQNLGRQKSVVLAIDRSRSMKGRALDDALAAARAFVAAKRPGDRVGVVAFASRAVRLADLSGSTIDADIALRSVALDSRPGTALHDAVDIAARTLAGDVAKGRVIVLLTDGSDQASESTLAEAIGSARKAGVSVHAIAIESAQFSPEALQRIARETGGTYRATRSTSQLRSLYGALGAELARTWELEYVTAARPGEKVALDVRVPGAGSASTELTLPETGAAPLDGRPTRLLPGFAYATGVGTLFAGVVVGLLVLGAATIAMTSVRGARLRRRLAPHLADAPRATTTEGGRERLAMAAGLFEATERAFAHLRFWHKLGRLIERADLPLRTVELLYMCIGTGFVFGLVAAFAALPALLILAALLGGGLLPVGFVWFKGRRRLSAFENQLPDLLIGMAATLKAGHSFKHALQTTADEGKPPASKELRRVLTEARLGRPIDEALAEMAERVGSKNFEFVITAVSIQNQVGGSLAGLIDMVADTVRQRHQFARKIKGLTAMGRAGAYVLMGLPFVLALAITVINPGYMDPLYHSSSGHKLIYLGLGMMAFGSLVLNKIVSFKG
ncbi:MAG: VWA domain-containing protein [Thermoleophilia bacterium]|nr:VWA domain-containing protein [Thermoleophilia bacterium]